MNKIKILFKDETSIIVYIDYSELTLLKYLNFFMFIKFYVDEHKIERMLIRTELINSIVLCKDAL